ncbi:MAG: peptide ABC transporter substrate-binding protein [Thermoprotei archaeon]|nr:MAG: peptide ABC transporter substrate-binding protein [Thermoprotei archaeon]
MVSQTTLTVIFIVLLIIVGVGAYFAGVSVGGPAVTTTVTQTVIQTTTVVRTTTVSQTVPPTPIQTIPTAPATTPTPTVSTVTYVTEKLTIGTTDKVTDLDPSNAYDFFTWEILYNVMDGLVKYEPGTDRIVPAIAERWEIKEDGKVWIFYLKKNVRFCDGTPLTAHDVVRSVKRVMTIQGDPSWLVTEFVEDVRALDDYTVEFVLQKPVGYFLAVLATPPYFPVHPNYPDDEIVSDATWGGAGPYCIKEFKRDQYIVLEANPYYYGEPPKTKTIIVKFYKDATTLRLAFENREVDIAWRTLRPTDYEDLKKNPNYNVIEIPGSFIRYIVVNVQMEPTNNKLVRQAVAAAIDRQELAEVVFLGTMEPLYSMVPAGLWSHIDVFKEKYGDGNIELAKQLLKQAGYDENNKLHLELWYTPTHYGDTEADLAQLIKEQLEATGVIEVELKSSEWATYVDQLREGQMMLSLLGWYPDYLDPDDFLYPFLHSRANKWTGTGYANPEVDSLLEQAAVKPNQDERAELYEQVQEILAEDVPYIPLLQGKLIIVTHKDVEGVKVGPTMLLSYWTIYRS